MAAGMKCIINIFTIICCIQVQHCYDFNASAIINLTKDDGWSQFGAACVGYLETNNFTAYGGAAGMIDITFTVPINAKSIEYMLVLYDDQSNSFPMVNRTNLTCQERIGAYYRYIQHIELEPGNTWNRTIYLHQHFRPRWWYFYLVNCNQSLIFPSITATYSYRDNKSDTEICTNPSGITTTSVPITSTDSGSITSTLIPTNPTDSGSITSTLTPINPTGSDSTTSTLIPTNPTDSGSITSTLTPINPTDPADSGSTTSGGIKVQTILMWILTAIIIVVVIGLFIGFGVNFMNKQRNKKLNQTENLLMGSLNEKEIAKDQEAYILLKKWSLQQYGDMLIYEKGYDDIEQWKDLNESDLQRMGFKEGHSRKFVNKVNEYFLDILVEEEVTDNNDINDVNVIREEMVENEDGINEGEGYTNQ